jgi:hypothetical protein
MNREVRIIFEGIIVLGPGCPLDPPFRDDGPLYGVMPRVLRHESRWTRLPPPPPEPPRPPIYIPVHFPAIFTDLKPGGSRPPDETIQTYSIWYPVRERMQFRFSESVEPKDLQYIRGTNPASPCAPVPGEPDPLQDIAKISDFREIWPERQWLRNGMLQAGPNVSELVAAQVFVPSGYIGSHGEFRKEYEADAEFRPPRTQIPVRKKLLPQIVVKVSTESVHVDLYSLNTGEPLDSLAFVLNPVGPNIIRVANGDPMNIRYVIEHLLDPTHAVEPAYVKPTGKNINGEDDIGDVDFEGCYEVLAGYDDGGYLPIPWTPKPLGGRNCNGAMVRGEEPGQSSAERGPQKSKTPPIAGEPVT